MMETVFVRMLKDVVSDLPNYLWDGRDLTAFKGHIHEGQRTPNGVVFIYTHDGSNLGVKLDEFEIVSPTEPEKVAEPDPAEWPKTLRQLASEALVMAYSQALLNVFENLSISMAAATDDDGRNNATQRAACGMVDARNLLVTGRVLIKNMNAEMP